MRPSRFLVALPLLAAGCISSSNGGPPNDDAGPLPGEDSGLPPLPDATVPVDSSLNDSSVPPPDTSVPPKDSAPPVDAADAADAGPAPVTLIVTNDVGPEPGVLVLFHDPSGAVIGNATTGANGRVTQLLAPNSQVTAVLQGPLGMAFTTIQGVQPGDTLTAFDSTNPALAGSSVSVNFVSLDSGAPDATTFVAVVGSTQGSNSASPVTINGVSFPSELGGTFPVLLLAGTPTGEPGYTYANGNMLPLDGGPATVTVTNPWVHDENAPAFTLTNTPTALSDAATSNYAIEYGEISGNVPTTQTVLAQPTADGGYLATFNGHPSYPDSIQVEGTVRQDLPNPAVNAYTYETMIAVANRSPADAAVGLIDMSQALPEIVSSALDSTEAGTSAQPVISWKSLGSLAAADGLVVLNFFKLTLADGGVVSSVPWSIVLPPSATTATPPALPASVGTPSVITTNQYLVPTVMAVEASYLANYAQMRQAAATIVPTINELNVSNTYLQNAGSGPVAPTLPVDGTLRLTAVTYSGD